MKTILLLALATVGSLGGAVARADAKADGILKNSTQNVFSGGEESTYVIQARARSIAR
jgi:hypothetical protein